MFECGETGPSRRRVVFVVAMFLLVGAGWLLLRGTYRSGKEFTESSLKAIGQSWNLDELVDRAHPNLVEDGVDDLARTLDDIRRLIGPLTELSVMDSETSALSGSDLQRVWIFWRIDGEKDWTFLQTRVVREGEGPWRFDVFETP